MEELSLASKVRKFFDDLFYSKLVGNLERELLMSRSDAERMRQEYQGIIAELRAEKAQMGSRILMYEAKAGLRMPSQTPSKPTFGADFSIPPMKSKWQIVVEQHEAQIARELDEERIAKEKGVASAT